MWMLIYEDLDVIKHFIRNHLQLIDTEYEAIMLREELDEFKDSDERDDALSLLMHEEAIVLRAVYYELSSLIEFNMRLISTELIDAEKGLEQRQANSINIFFNPQFSIGKLIDKIKDATGLDITGIEGYDILHQIRTSLNAFKHRGGLKGPKDMSTVFPEYFKIEREEAFEAIEKVSKFLEQLIGKARAKRGDVKLE